MGSASISVNNNRSTGAFPTLVVYSDGFLPAAPAVVSAGSTDATKGSETERMEAQAVRYAGWDDDASETRSIGVSPATLAVSDSGGS